METVCYLQRKDIRILNTKFLAFDLEIEKEIPEGVTDWKEVAPLGITCAALLMSDYEKYGGYLLKFHNYDFSPISGAMDDDELNALVDMLMEFRDDGYDILTWNGLGFDLQVLAQESGRFEDCSSLAIGHVDMMFHFLCRKGFPLGLNTAATGLGLGGKTEGMKGDLAPILWKPIREKLPKQFRYMPDVCLRWKVLEYVGQDVVMTLEVANTALSMGGLSWVSRSGRSNMFSLPKNAEGEHRWLTVKQALELPEPDTSWMKNPMKRGDFLDWLVLK